MKKRIVLCADDYGQAPEVSQGIINLLRAGRLSAVSCMVNTPYWVEHAQWLRPFAGVADLGLHVNLTEGRALSSEYVKKHGEEFQPLSRVLCSALLRQLDRRAIEAECHAQIDRFQEAAGMLPQFLDGHQHVHQFPIVRDVVVQVYHQRLRLQKTYIRLVNEPLKFRDVFLAFKKVIIRLSGTRAFNKLLESNYIPYNQSFAGIYDFRRVGAYPRLFVEFLQSVQDGGLIMCHPGLYAPESQDLIASARYAEYQYLSGDRFPEDCRRQDVALVRGGVVQGGI
ncbi:Carbohydrate deacetylase [Aquicella siphonis]|uniref:Carbohydrate deacetylase n=1 Tax=Aquicella siphonis TaxID=254247 RepID=A0A5E4PGX2_9COXI|nr:ChbG/HpnK family deacetylase [Aquicella siphonis]VVC75707.1 Carbohydrate deacetylase [Aquicella siphonis]